jgi:predicted negative regulator of RcsB-dependent stress response
MAYIAGLVITGLFFLSLHYFTELTKSQKAMVTAFVLAIILGAIAWNGYGTHQRENMMNVVTKFKQGKTVTCNGTDINNSNYTLSIGTYTFIGKEDTPNYGQMVSASDCE